MRAVEMLVVEDNAGDTTLIREALHCCSVPVRLHIARDGEEALLILMGTHLQLDLILLDLNIPKIPGTVLLQVLQIEEEPLQKVPVVVFTSSADPSERERCLSLGARDLISKPTDLQDFEEAVCKIVEKWATPEENLVRC